MKFPNQSLGVLQVGEKIEGAQNVGQARGFVRLTVPANQIVILSVSGLLSRSSDLLLQAPQTGIDGLEVSLMDMESEKRSASDCLLKNITHLENLSTIRVGCSDITEQGVEYLSKESSLVFVDIRLAHISEKAMKSLASMPNLKFLRLGLVTTSDSELKALKTMQKLRFLDLDGSNGISDGTAEAVSQLTNLQTLSFSRNKVHNEGLQHIGKLTGLTNLMLDGTLITDIAIENLVGCSHLQHLNIGDNQYITDNCIGALLKLHTLTSLNISKTKISWAGIKRLKALHLELLVVDSRQIPDVRKAEATSLAKRVAIASANDEKARELKREKTNLFAPLH